MERDKVKGGDEEERQQEKDDDDDNAKLGLLSI
jgi:hypothetical protein